MSKKQAAIFVVKRKGSLPKALRGLKFSSYEEARSQVRRYIRSMKTYQPTHRHPIMGDHGFSIVQG